MPSNIAEGHCSKYIARTIATFARQLWLIFDI